MECLRTETNVRYDLEKRMQKQMAQLLDRSSLHHPGDAEHDSNYCTQNLDDTVDDAFLTYDLLRRYGVIQSSTSNLYFYASQRGDVRLQEKKSTSSVYERELKRRSGYVGRLFEDDLKEDDIDDDSDSLHSDDSIENIMSAQPINGNSDSSPSGDIYGALNRQGRDCKKNAHGPSSPCKDITGLSEQTMYMDDYEKRKVFDNIRNHRDEKESCSCHNCIDSQCVGCDGECNNSYNQRLGINNAAGTGKWARSNTPKYKSSFTVDKYKSSNSHHVRQIPNTSRCRKPESERYVWIMGRLYDTGQTNGWTNDHIRCVRQQKKNMHSENKTPAAHKIKAQPTEHTESEYTASIIKTDHQSDVASPHSSVPVKQINALRSDDTHTNDTLRDSAYSSEYPNAASQEQTVKTDAIPPSQNSINDTEAKIEPTEQDSNTPSIRQSTQHSPEDATINSESNKEKSLPGQDVQRKYEENVWNPKRDCKCRNVISDTLLSKPQIRRTAVEDHRNSEYPDTTYLTHNDINTFARYIPLESKAKNQYKSHVCNECGYVGLWRRGLFAPMPIQSGYKCVIPVEIAFKQTVRNFSKTSNVNITALVKKNVPKNSKKKISSQALQEENDPNLPTNSKGTNNEESEVLQEQISEKSEVSSKNQESIVSGEHIESEPNSHQENIASKDGKHNDVQSLNNDTSVKTDYSTVHETSWSPFKAMFPRRVSDAEITFSKSFSRKEPTTLEDAESLPFTKKIESNPLSIITDSVSLRADKTEGFDVQLCSQTEPGNGQVNPGTDIDVEFITQKAAYSPNNFKPQNPGISYQAEHDQDNETMQQNSYFQSFKNVQLLAGYNRERTSTRTGHLGGGNIQNTKEYGEQFVSHQNASINYQSTAPKGILQINLDEVVVEQCSKRKDTIHLTDGGGQLHGLADIWDIKVADNTLEESHRASSKEFLSKKYQIPSMKHLYSVPRVHLFHQQEAKTTDTRRYKSEHRLDNSGTGSSKNSSSEILLRDNALSTSQKPPLGFGVQPFHGVETNFSNEKLYLENVGLSGQSLPAVFDETSEYVNDGENGENGEKNDSTESDEDIKWAEPFLKKTESYETPTNVSEEVSGRASTVNELSAVQSTSTVESGNKSFSFQDIKVNDDIIVREFRPRSPCYETDIDAPETEVHCPEAGTSIDPPPPVVEVVEVDQKQTDLPKEKGQKTGRKSRKYSRKASAKSHDPPKISTRASFSVSHAWTHPPDSAKTSQAIVIREQQTASGRNSVQSSKKSMTRERLESRTPRPSRPMEDQKHLQTFNYDPSSNKRLSRAFVKRPTGESVDHRGKANPNRDSVRTSVQVFRCPSCSTSSSCDVDRKKAETRAILHGLKTIGMRSALHRRTRYLDSCATVLRKQTERRDENKAVLQNGKKKRKTRKPDVMPLEEKFEEMNVQSDMSLIGLTSTSSAMLRAKLSRERQNICDAQQQRKRKMTATTVKREFPTNKEKYKYNQMPLKSNLPKGSFQHSKRWSHGLRFSEDASKSSSSKDSHSRRVSNETDRAPEKKSQESAPQKKLVGHSTTYQSPATVSVDVKKMFINKRSHRKIIIPPSQEQITRELVKTYVKTVERGMLSFAVESQIKKNNTTVMTESKHYFVA